MVVHGSSFLILDGEDLNLMAFTRTEQTIVLTGCTNSSNGMLIVPDVYIFVQEEQAHDA